MHCIVPLYSTVPAILLYFTARCHSCITPAACVSLTTDNMMKIISLHCTVLWYCAIARHSRHDTVSCTVHNASYYNILYCTSDCTARALWHCHHGSLPCFICAECKSHEPATVLPTDHPSAPPSHSFTYDINCRRTHDYFNYRARYNYNTNLSVQVGEHYYSHQTVHEWKRG